MSIHLPKSASAVIIGGGIIGISAAYYLAAAGVRDIVLIERGSLGSGSSGRASGGIRTQFSDRVNVELSVRSGEFLKSFERRFGSEIGFHQNGYLFLLDTSESVLAFGEDLKLQEEFDLGNEMISPTEAQRLCHHISKDGLKAAAYSPGDGYCDPGLVMQGLSSAAERKGALLVENCPVIAIDTDGERITGVQTPYGRIATDTVVCAAGAWAAHVADLAGISLPILPLRRQVAHTERLDYAQAQMPFTLDFGTSLYLRNAGDSLLIGYSDPAETSGFDRAVTESWLSAATEALKRRAPGLVGVPIANTHAGLYEMTPDRNGLVGEAQGLSRFIYAAGFSGHGFMMGPAIGEIVRDIYQRNRTFTDVTGLRVERFSKAELRPERNVI